VAPSCSSCGLSLPFFLQTTRPPGPVPLLNPFLFSQPSPMSFVLFQCLIPPIPLKAVAFPSVTLRNLSRASPPFTFFSSTSSFSSLPDRLCPFPLAYFLAFLVSGLMTPSKPHPPAFVSSLAPATRLRFVSSPGCVTQKSPNGFFDTSWFPFSPYPLFRVPPVPLSFHSHTACL